MSLRDKSNGTVSYFFLYVQAQDAGEKLDNSGFNKGNKTYAS